MAKEKTQVGIIGAGPAGLMLSHLLARAGIDSVVLERRSREYVEKRVRAGVLEQGTVNLMRETGLGARLDREGLVHRGIALRFEGSDHRIDFEDLTGGSTITVYGQQEVVKDLIAARLAAGQRLHFEVEDASAHDVSTSAPTLRYTLGGESVELECDFIAGCDGFHGVSREAIPADHLTSYEREYPFGWVGILASVAPSSDELIYASHDRGFALLSMRSPTLTRLYVQCDRTDTIDDWPDARIWEELHLRLATDEGFTLTEGPVVEKTIAWMHSLVTEPMQYGRLFLAGDAAHIVPATGAKGLNLAVHDVRVLSAALDSFYRTGSPAALASYSDVCLRRVWRAQHFSYWMTTMLHRFPTDDAFQRKLQLAQLRWVTSSRDAAASLAENYVGIVKV
ncbi:MAG TPA: 4-hydroxybenzoate 3-monooxygenase [Gemmatimonadaceae bacterium]|nr:4-hydroxybenzoate 3-monooxygenase [Gemmatimonadaceae bacterium]